MFKEDLEKADLQDGERVEAMRAADILKQLQNQEEAFHIQAK